MFVPVPVPQLTRDVNPCGSHYPCHSLLLHMLSRPRKKKRNYRIIEHTGRDESAMSFPSHGPLVCFFFISFAYYSTTNYYVTTCVQLLLDDDQHRGNGQCGTCSLAQDTSFDVSWPFGTYFTFLLLILQLTKLLQVFTSCYSTTMTTTTNTEATDNAGHAVWPQTTCLGLWYVFYTSFFYFTTN